MFRASLLLLLSASAAAVPLEISHQGRILDSAGAPLDGGHDVDVHLYGAPSGGSPLWSDTFAPDFDAGHFHLVLGSAKALDSALFDGDALYVAIAVDGGPELPTRLPLTSVPYALRAGQATDLVGGTVDASEIRIDGATVIDSDGRISWSALDDVPSVTDTLSELGCGPDEVAVSDGTDWSCALAAAHAHHTDDVVNGTLAVARLPIGTGADEVAAGDHGHTAAEVGAIAAGGGVPVGSDTATCGSGKAGTLRYAASGLQLCDGSAWRAIKLVGTRGHAETEAGKSCLDILESGSSVGDGTYWINPTGSSAYQVHCDMTTAGGGWTLVNAKVTPSYVAWSNFFDPKCATTTDKDCKSAVDSGLAWKTAMWRFSTSTDQVVLWRSDAHALFRDYLRGAQSQANPNIGGWSKINQGIPTGESTVSAMHYYYNSGISENHGGSDQWIDLWSGSDSTNSYNVQGSTALSGTKCLAGYCKADPVWLMVR